MYIGVNDQAKKVSNAYIGVNGQAKQISKIYVGVNGQAKLAWENFSPFEEELPSNLEFNNLNAVILNKEEKKYINYLVPETNWYQIELISPFTESLLNLTKGLQQGTIEYAFGELKDDNINVIDLTNTVDYASEIIRAKSCPSSGLKQLQFKVNNLVGPSLGRGSSYASKILKLKKGETIRFSWLDYGYTNFSSEEQWGRQLKVAFPNSPKINELRFYSNPANKHEFLNVDQTDFSPISTGEDDTHLLNLSTNDVLEEDENGIITLKINSTRTKFYGVTNSLEDKFETINSMNKVYGIYNTSNTIINSKKCQELGLGSNQNENGVGNASIYFNLNFSLDYKYLQFEAGQKRKLTGEIFPGCFRITPATIKNN